MKTSSGLLKDISTNNVENANLIFYAFDRVDHFKQDYEKLRANSPNAQLVGFSTAGHFFSDTIQDNETVYSAIEFEHSEVICKSRKCNNIDQSRDVGEYLGKEFKDIKNLKGITIISDGNIIDGTELMKGLNSQLDSSIPLFGGMAGDQARFEETYVGVDDIPEIGNVVAVGFVGEKLTIKSACQDGWTRMGMAFTITKSEGNVLYELDNENAYDTLYKLLESKSQDEFMTNTLHYPFKLNTEENNDIIRTPLSIDHEKKVITYAGHMPQNQTVELMKASSMDLLDSAANASIKADTNSDTNSFGMAISCLGRRAVLSDLANEEYTEVKNIFGDKATVFGFYSYGEYSRLNNENNHCLLHNQTFTVASITEE